MKILLLSVMSIRVAANGWVLAFVADFGTQNFQLKTKFDMENKISTNHENGNDANRLLAAVFNQIMDNKIKSLRTFFRVSNAAFEMQNSIQLALSGHIVPSKMHQLHKLALVEIEKETPDLSLIDKLLAEMESTAEQMKPKPNFPKGGV